MAGIARLLAQTTTTAEVKKVLQNLPDLHGDIRILDKAKSMINNKKSLNALENLQKLWQKISLHPLAPNVFFDLSEVEGMGYYTGIMLKAFAPGVGTEIGSGGRYDQLTAVFGTEMPAIGFSFDVHLLASARLMQQE